MRSVTMLLSVVVGLLSASVPCSAAVQRCRIIDLIPQFWQVVEASGHESPAQQVQDFRKHLVDNHGDLYFATGLGFQSDKKLSEAIQNELAEARKHPEAMRKMTRLLQREMPQYVSAFQHTFPDFKCNFPIYMVPALGKLDGAGRVVNHVPSLVFGIDDIAAEFSEKTLPIFIDHELFHRYHFQVAGFSDDKGAHDILWRTLWAEGLATYVSKALNPGVSMQDALILPKDLEQRARPQLPALIAKLTPQLDRVDPQTFSVYFGYHPSETVIPSRVGYYIGALAAERLAGQYSLFALAHLQAATVRAKLPQALAEVARAAQH
ncbi:MAG TPA: hypothetical protein VFE38_06585 [Edaphobacter sp.]|nr:hypothetical protein [Edaphobacter sp.]